MQSRKTILVLTVSLIAFLAALFYLCCDNGIVYRDIDTPDDIVDINSRIVQPIAYTSVVSIL